MWVGCGSDVGGLEVGYGWDGSGVQIGCWWDVGGVPVACICHVCVMPMWQRLGVRGGWRGGAARVACGVREEACERCVREKWHAGGSTWS